MASAEDKMLPPFHIKNLRSPLDIVRVSAPRYEETLSSDPSAALRYDDDDGDVITVFSCFDGTFRDLLTVSQVGSSFELGQQLGERPSTIQRRQLAELHKSRKPSPDSEPLHVFSINSSEKVQDVWRKLQESSRFEPQSNLATSRDCFTVREPSPERKFSSECIVMRNDFEKFENSLPMSGKPLDEPSSREVLYNPAKSSSTATSPENQRIHYFNITSPPQLHGPEKISNVTNGQAVQAKKRTDADLLAPLKAPDAAEGQGVKARIDTEQDVLAANLTLEGKRQAQLAGEKFRARGLYSRPRKMSAGQADRSSYHNRWASYKSNENPKSFISYLTPEGKRQAQNAGDRLRSRSSRIRHAVKGLSDQATSTEDNLDFITVPNSRAPPNKAEEAGKTSSDGQKSLLEVFETELAKHPRDSVCQTDTPSVPFNRPSAPFKPILTDPAKHFASASRQFPPQATSNTIEDGIKTAVSSFEACLRGIVHTLKAAQPSRPDKEMLGETMIAFQDLADKVAPRNAVSFDTKFRFPTPKADTKARPITEDIEKLDSQSPIITTYTSMIPEVWKPHGKKMQQNSSDLLPPLASQATDTRMKLKELNFEDQKTEFISDFAGPFQYHRPGPIHLPQQTLRRESSPLKQRGGAALKKSGYVDHLRRINSVDVLRNPLTARWQQDSNPSNDDKQDRSVSPTAVSTRFPTIGQFENATFPTQLAPPAPPSLIDLDPEIGPELSPGAKLSGAVNGTESSGEFFKRMTTTRTPKSEAPLSLQNEQFLNRSIGVSDGSAASKARLLRPFDAFKAEAEATPLDQRDIGLHRSMTVAAPSLRRPHSEIFNGNGRAACDPLTSQQRDHGSDERLGAETSSTSLPLPAPMTTLSRPLSSVKPAENSGIRRSATDAGACRETYLRPRDSRVRKCVDSLIGLGFDMERSRLRVYASVAEGDLDEAIDMLTEDQKVHESRK